MKNKMLERHLFTAVGMSNLLLKQAEDLMEEISRLKKIYSIEKILIQYKGNDDIYVCTEQPRRMFKWNSMKVNLNSPLEIKLQELLGKENVKVKI